MGSKPSHSDRKQSMDSNFFKEQIEHMKFQKNNIKFKQRSEQANLAIGHALVNLKKNNILNNNDFKKLQGNGQNSFVKFRPKHKSERNVRKARVPSTLNCIKLEDESKNINYSFVQPKQSHKNGANKGQSIIDKSITVIQL